MTMVLDQGRPFGGMSYDHMYSNNMQAPPSFSNPWSHQTSNPAAQYSSMPKPESHRPSLSMPSPYSLPPTSAPLASGSDYSTVGIDGTDSLSYHQDIPRSSYGEQQYSSPQNAASYATASYPSSMTYAQSMHSQQAHQQRKMSEAGPDVTRGVNPSFGELDASRGMLALSHQNVQDLTPRNIYDVRAQRGSDAYGFPGASNHSSISNESGRGYPYYAASSVGSVSSHADSATDYSSAASDAGYDPMASRTLPRPSQLMGAPLGPPAPQSMMGQFSSKMSANTQKKHKCKVCDKRFTRPSSLQTHMYSHTGEKPFACNVDGCGRHFSVVSNLRRHKKVHKGEAAGGMSDNED